MKYIGVPFAAIVLWSVISTASRPGPALNSPAIAVEQGTQSEVAMYIESSGLSWTQCSLNFTIAQYRASSAQSTGKTERKLDEDSDYVTCITDREAEARAYLAQTLRTVTKPKAREALKEYHVAFITALRGILPGMQELRIDYDRRQLVLKGKLDEMLLRFQMEE
jgi:hypothetical protein